MENILDKSDSGTDLDSSFDEIAIQEELRKAEKDINEGNYKNESGSDMDQNKSDDDTDSGDASNNENDDSLTENLMKDELREDTIKEELEIKEELSIHKTDVFGDDIILPELTKDYEQEQRTRDRERRKEIKSKKELEEEEREKMQ